MTIGGADREFQIYFLVTLKLHAYRPGADAAIDLAGERMIEHPFGDIQDVCKATRIAVSTVAPVYL